MVNLRRNELKGFFHSHFELITFIIIAFFLENLQLRAMRQVFFLSMYGYRNLQDLNAETFFLFFSKYREITRIINNFKKILHQLTLICEGEMSNDRLPLVFC